MNEIDPQPGPKRDMRLRIEPPRLQRRSWPGVRRILQEQGMDLRVDDLAAVSAEPALINMQAETSAPTQPFLISTAISDFPVENLVVTAPVAAPSPTPLHRYPDALQRCLDVTIASACLILLWPLFLLCAIMVRLSGPGPIIYCHQRVGRGGKVFCCLKFRTMRPDADQRLQEVLDSSPAMKTEWLKERKLHHDPRVTTIGRFMRRYSLDELPQFINVLRGEMSIVGPRPLATDETHYYAEYFATYCALNPGITGMWQVNGRSNIGYDRRIQLDCEYARARSLPGDLWIILKTVPVTLRGTGC